MNSLQIDIMIFIMGYIVAFITYLFNREIGLQLRNTITHIIIVFVIYIMICSVY